MEGLFRGVRLTQAARPTLHGKYYGRTPLNRAPIGFYAKVRVFKSRFEGEAAIF